MSNTFAHKVCNGVAVVIIKKFVPDSNSPNYKDYFAEALSWGCGTAALLGPILSNIFAVIFYTVTVIDWRIDGLYDVESEHNCIFQK